MKERTSKYCIQFKWKSWAIFFLVIVSMYLVAGGLSPGSVLLANIMGVYFTFMFFGSFRVLMTLLYFISPENSENTNLPLQQYLGAGRYFTLVRLRKHMKVKEAK